MAAERITPQEAHEHMESGIDSMLVCAYDDVGKYDENHLEGAISLADFRDQEDSISKDREIIFYCA